MRRWPALTARAACYRKPPPRLPTGRRCCSSWAGATKGLATLDLALAAEPELAAAWYARADAKSFAADDPDIAAMERLLLPRPAHRRRGQQPERERLLLHYALGKAYLDIKDAARAFAHLNAGSRLKRARLDYDAAAAARAMTAIAEAFPAALIAGLGDGGEPDQTPVFILGMPRSGTTLVEQILASHPLVHGGGEPRHIERLVRDLGDAYPAGVATLPPERLAALGRRYLAMAGPATPGALRVTDKMPNNFLHAGLIHGALPGARIIHCRRDPVDTCLSCYSKLFSTGQEFSYDLVELGDYYRGYAALMARIGARCFRPTASSRWITSRRRRSRGRGAAVSSPFAASPGTMPV